MFGWVWVCVRVGLGFKFGFGWVYVGVELGFGFGLGQQLCFGNFRFNVKNPFIPCHVPCGSSLSFQPFSSGKCPENSRS